MIQPIKIAIMAMGGEGGGVLADWLVDLAEHAGWIAQSTSVPGVAQRTGATIYYVEIFPGAEARAVGRRPILALMPMPGDVDVVLASELMEAGRAVQRGLVTPERTVFVASTHRVFSITEKSALGDGRASSEVLLDGARAAARRFVGFDMAAVAARTNSALSAVLFGALAGARALPFDAAAFEQTIERAGIGVGASRVGFASGLAAAAEAARHAPPEGEASSATVDIVGARATAAPPPADAPLPPAAPAVTAPPDPLVRVLLERVDSLPAAARPIAVEGIRRCIDWQDPAYAHLYLDRLERVGAASAEPTLVAETARHLALWMTYEDTVRVAQLKTRATRFDRVRDEVRAAPGQIVGIDEYLHPRVQEIAETLPAWLGRRLERPGVWRRLAERATRRGRVVTTTSLGGFLLLRLTAGLRRIRRSTSRFAVESERIEAWLATIESAARRDPPLATEIARCQRLVKGYAETHERGLRHYSLVMEAIAGAGAAISPARVRRLRDAALADERGDALRDALAEPLAA